MKKKNVSEKKRKLKKKDSDWRLKQKLSVNESRKKNVAKKRRLRKRGSD